MTNMHYQGEPAGNLSFQEMEELESDYRMAKSACMGGFACFFLAACLCATVAVGMPASPVRRGRSWAAEVATVGEQHPARGALMVEPAEPYNCRQGLADGGREWSFEKKVWCCSHYDVGCPEDNPTPVVFDCRSGFTIWEEAWTVEKKDWCCEHFFPLGCELTTPTPFDCVGIHAGDMSEWTQSKKAWCCTNEHTGCPTQAWGTDAFAPVAPSPATASPVTSWPESGYSVEAVSTTWVPSVATALPVTSAPESGFSWEAAAPTWVPSVATAAPTASPTVAAAATLAPTASSSATASTAAPRPATTAAPEAIATTAAPTASAAAAASTAAPTPATTAATKATTAAPTKAATTAEPRARTSYDCQAGARDWKHKWSPAKQDFCCTTFNLPCGSNAPPDSSSAASSPAASAAEQHDGEASKKPEEKAEEQATPSTSRPAAEALSKSTEGLFDCKVGLNSAEKLWSGKKRDYCCRHDRLGCPSPPPSTASPPTQAPTTPRTPAPAPEASTTAAPTPAPAEPTPAPAREAGKGGACEASCSAEGTSSTCAEMMQMVADFMFPTEADACPLALKSTVKDCPHCASCSVAEAKCISQIEMLQLASNAPFQCGPEKPVRWPEDKRKWCCEHASRGC